MASKSKIAKANRAPKFMTRKESRCKLCGRPRAVYRKFGLCRICFRKKGNQGSPDQHQTSGFPRTLYMCSSSVLPYKSIPSDQRSFLSPCTVIIILLYKALFLLGKNCTQNRTNRMDFQKNPLTEQCPYLKCALNKTFYYTFLCKQRRFYLKRVQNKAIHYTIYYTPLFISRFENLSLARRAIIALEQQKGSPLRNCPF